MILAKTLLRSKPNFSKSITTLNGVSLIQTQDFLSRPKSSKHLCKDLADSFLQTGAVIIKDPRATQDNFSEFQFMLEWYFEHRARQYYAGHRHTLDCLPGLYRCGPKHGIVPDHILSECKDELPLHLKNSHHNHKPPPADAQWRIDWRVGEDPIDDAIHEEPPRHIPKDFPHWRETIDKWGYSMMEIADTVSEMLAIGLGAPEKVFTDRLRQGPHLLIPSGIDMARHEVGTFFANPHIDTNFLTMHGHAKYPGLHIVRHGVRTTCAFEDGTLFLMAGMGLQKLTNGLVKAPCHELIFNEEAQANLEKAKQAGTSTWRVASTFFSCLRPEVRLEGIPLFVGMGNLVENLINIGIGSERPVKHKSNLASSI